jgi:drug/metabolite transporter (DMT)-like permease
VATGPLALSSLLISYSLILPALYGIVFLNEPMTTPMIIAIILLLISATLTNLEGKQEKKRITPKWMIFVLLSFLGNGSCSIIQKMEQIRFNGGYKNEFMIIALLLVVVFIFGAALITERGNLRKNAPAAIICSAAAGLTNGGVNLLVMVLTGLMATSIMFPAISAGGIIVTFLIALLIYKEKLSVYQYLGALFGIAAIILFNI